MFLVETFIACSPIHGIGVYAREDIPVGTKVISLEHELCFSVDAFENLPEVTRKYIRHYGYQQDNRFYLPLDNERFLNHSKTPNLISRYSTIYTGEYSHCDIIKGTELTVDYGSFDQRGIYFEK